MGARIPVPLQGLRLPPHRARLPRPHAQHSAAGSPKPTENEKTGLIERRRWAATELHHCPDKLLPDDLAELLDDLLAGHLSGKPLALNS
ncbi:MAG: hypothetical protein ACRDTC_21280 [Pseudonocardiaceae bacterium]